MTEIANENGFALNKCAAGVFIVVCGTTEGFVF